MRKEQDMYAITPEETWLVYMLECSDGSFYTGITNHLERRLLQHNSGRASRYTRSRLPVKVIYQEICINRAQALSREMTIKSLTRTNKQQLIEMNKQGSPSL
ncbi:MAG: GIY-YIG nuclease family protein [Gammaproteobacteria bacterium]